MECTRRQILKLGAAAGAGLFLPGCLTGEPPLENISFSSEDYRRLPVLGLATTLEQEYHYQPRIEGTLPADLQGTLYRNGPGRFDRNGLRKRCLLDGDGMVQAFRFENGRATYRNRFVRTRKYTEESAAGKFLYATWSTQAPGSFLSNLGGGDFASQAGITVVARDNRLFAFDEFQTPYELDPGTLETRGETWMGLEPQQTIFSAHSKIDPRNGDWIFFGLDFGRRIDLHLTVFDANGRLKKHQVHELPRFAYVHDFFVTARHIVLNLHPVEMSVPGFLLGFDSMTGAMRWAPEKGNLVLVFNRDTDDPPVTLQAESAWMWHSLNAYDENSHNIVADFVGYQNPDHFLGEDPALFAIMQGREGNYRYPGELRRYHIDLSKKTLRQELLDPGNLEFPMVNPARLCHRHRFGYFASIHGEEKFFNGITRIDLENGKKQVYRFGPAVYCSEPVFAPQPGKERDKTEPGWLLTEVYDGHTRKSYLAILDAQNLEAGPVASVHLTHHVPLGFHGYWK